MTDIMEGNKKQVMGLIFLLINKTKNPEPANEQAANTELEGMPHNRVWKRPPDPFPRAASVASLPSVGKSQGIASSTTDSALTTKPNLREERPLVKREPLPASNQTTTGASPLAGHRTSPAPLTESAVIMAQSLIRRYLAQVTYRRMMTHLGAVLQSFTNTNSNTYKGLVRIQALIRGRLQRRKMKSRFKRNEIAREIISTEEVYVRRLHVLKSVYHDALSKLPAEVISPSMLRSIFSESEVIRLYNSEILKQLKARMEKWYSSGQKLGDIFFAMTEYLKVYTAYVNNYNTACSTLFNVMKKPQVLELLMQCRSRPECENLEISSFLILPVQRIPRYVLLLQDLFKSTPESHGDYQNLKKALEKMQSVAEYVNEKKREAENLNNTLLIWGKLSGLDPNYNFAVPHRRYVRQGRLLEIDGMSSPATLDPSKVRAKMRYCFLFTDMLVVTKEKSASSARKASKSGGHPSAYSMDELKQSDVDFKFLYIVPLKQSELHNINDQQSIKYANLFQIQGSDMPNIVTQVGPAVIAAQSLITLSGNRAKSNSLGDMAMANAITAPASPGPGRGSDSPLPASVTERRTVILAATTAQDKYDWLSDLDDSISLQLEAMRSRLFDTAQRREEEEKKSLSFMNGKVFMEGDLYKKGKHDEWKCKHFVLNGCILNYYPVQDKSATVVVDSLINAVSAVTHSATTVVNTSPQTVHDYLARAESEQKVDVTVIKDEGITVEVPSIVEPSGSIHVLGCTARALGIVDRPFSFQLLTRERIYFLSANNLDEKLQWINTIRKAVYLFLYDFKQREAKDKDNTFAAVQENRSGDNQNCVECGKESTHMSLAVHAWICSDCAQSHQTFKALNRLRALDKPNAWSADDVTASKQINNARHKDKYKQRMAGLTPPSAKDGAEARWKWISFKYEEEIRAAEEPAVTTNNSAPTTPSTEHRDKSPRKQRSKKDIKRVNSTGSSSSVKSNKEIEHRDKSPEVNNSLVSSMNKQGTLYRYRKKEYKKYKFVLENGSLKYFKPKKSKPDAVIHLSLCPFVQPSTPRTLKTHQYYAFELKTPERIYTIAADTKEECDEWIDAVNKLIHLLTKQ
jgi:hypothetical protein